MITSPAAAVAAPPAARRSPLSWELAEGLSVRRLIVMFAALVSLFIDQSFGSVYATVQSYAGGSLDASADEIAWATIDYNACYYTAIIWTPWLIAKIGRRYVFSSGHVVFGATSLYLASAGSLHGFLIGRAFEGLAQGTFFVSAVLTVLTLFPPQYRGYAFSIFSVTSLSGAASGAFIGGWFVDHADWRSAFVLYALLAVVAGLIVALLLEAPGPRDVPMDLSGVALAFVTFFAFQFVLAFGERRDWLSNGWIVGYSLVAAVAFVAFVLRELRDAAFLQLKLFGAGNLAVGSMLGFGLGAPLFGANEFLAFAQQQLGYPPSIAGALLTLRIIAIVVVAPTAVLLVNADKIDVKIPVVLGFLLVPLSYALLSLQTTFFSYFWLFGLALIVQGAGFACLFSPVANVTIRSLPPEHAAEGIAIFKMVLLLGGIVASTSLGVLYDHDLNSYQSLLAGNASAHTLYNAATKIAPATYAAYVAAQAAVLAYADNSKWIALSSLLMLPLVFFLKPPKKS